MKWSKQQNSFTHFFNAINDEIDKLKEEDPSDPLTTKKTLKYLSKSILELGGSLEDQAKFIEKER